MPARLIDGKSLAADVRAGVSRDAAGLRARGRSVRLDAVLCDTGDGGARLYAQNQAKTCGELGIEYRLHELPGNVGYDEVAGRVLLLSSDAEARAIMVHVPIPAGIDPFRVQRLIAPEKDVEGVNPANIGNIVYGHSSLVPCTALAVLRMIETTGLDLRGKRAVVVGASNVVGKPIAVLLMRHDATVISCNKWTENLADLTRSADVLVAAAGVPELIKGPMVKPGAVVVDVGVNRVARPDGTRATVGDVDFAGASGVAGWISPVPGGVGPMTVAMLVRNVVDACAGDRPR